MSVPFLGGQTRNAVTTAINPKFKVHTLRTLAVCALSCAMCVCTFYKAQQSSCPISKARAHK